MKSIAMLVLVLLLGLPLAAHAQDRLFYTPETKWRYIELQLVETLESSVDGIRTQSLKNAVIFATLYRDQVDLSRAVSAIRTVYEDDERASNRKLALAALQAIGSEWAKDYVARHVPKAEVEESRLLMATVLTEYYAEKIAALE